MAVLPAMAAAAPAASVMPIGRCAGSAEIDRTKRAGFAFQEMGVQGYARKDEAEWKQQLAQVKTSGIRVPVSNSFVPGNIKLTGPDVSVTQQNEYLEIALSRARQLGVKIVVFGSGGARNVPEGFARDQALYQLIDFGRRAAAVAKRHGIVIAIEPLNKKECNIINTAAEGLQLVEAIDRPNFQLMIDFYHMTLEHEDPAIVLTAGKRLRHIHISTPERTFPQGPKGADYATFFENLHRIGYRGGISVEAKEEPEFETVAPKTVAFLQSMVGTTAETVARERRKK